MNTIRYTGTIEFDLENVTRKHESQASWKKTAFVMFDGDVAEYYQWFLKKRFDLTLNRPLRGAHISFINDSINDLGGNLNRWDIVKAKYNETQISVELCLDPRTDVKYWWLNVTPESRLDLQTIRNELGLGTPYFGLHMTIGHVNDKNYAHSAYIHKLLTQKGFIVP